MALTPLDFPASPTVGQLYPDPPVTGQPTYKWDGAQWLSYAAASLPTPTKPINYGKKNYIINGAMMVSQENGGAVGTTSGFYPVDMFSVAISGTSGALTVQQVTTASPGGSPNRIRVAVTTADAAVAPGDIVWILAKVEGLRFADLRFGSAAAKTITIQFGVKAPAGTYCVTLRNGAANRGYAAEYIIAAGEANTDVVKSVTLTGDTAGTWATDNTPALEITWGLMVGSTYQTPANAWAGGNFLGSPNQFNFMGTALNAFELFDVSLTEGTVAPPFQVPDYAQELQACQRYWRWIPFNLYFSAGTPGYVAGHSVYFPTMRANPTISAVTADPATTQTAANNASNTFSNITPTSAMATGAATASGAYQVTGYRAATNARL